MFNNYQSLLEKVDEVIDRDRKELDKERLYQTPKEALFFESVKKKKSKSRIFSIVRFLRRDASL
jgi:hypothetical protein